MGNTLEHKICKKCGVSKSLDSFSKRKDSKDGYGNSCKECEKERLRNRRSSISYEEAIEKGLEKVCTRCNILKPVKEYNKNIRGKYGSTPHCKMCEKERQKTAKSTISYEEAVKLNLTKVCRICKEEKSVQEFYRDSKSKFGVINVCKKCDSKAKKDSESLISYEEAIELNLTKVCSNCNTEKEIREFHKAKRGEFGVGSWCKECRKKYKREHYLKNEERIIQEKKDYYYANREILNYKKKIYRLKNKDKLKEIHRRYRQNNKDICRKHCNTRRSRIKNLTANLTVEQWDNSKKYFDNLCAYCRGKNSQGETLEQEHIIPLSKGGCYTADNIIPACRACNSSKGNKDMNEWFKAQNFYSESSYMKIIDYIEEIKKNM